MKSTPEQRAWLRRRAGDAARHVHDSACYVVDGPPSCDESKLAKGLNAVLDDLEKLREKETRWK